MQKEQYTKQELESKIRNGCRFLKIGIGVGVSGIFIALHSIFYEPEHPKIYENYVNAQRTIQILEYTRKSLEKIEIPYKNQIIKENIDSVYNVKREKISKLNKMLESVEKDISVMKESPEIIDYNNTKRKQNNKIGFGVLGEFFGGLLVVYNSLRWEKYKSKLKELKNKK